MIRLHPVPDADGCCPYCRVRLEIKGWYIPGMRSLADFLCPRCGRAYYGDLPVGHGLYYPMLLEQGNGKVHDTSGVGWFADWLQESYAHRISVAPGFTAEEFRPVKKPLLVNCLDGLYGHGLLKLLNAQHYLEKCPDQDLILLVPRFLRWLVPSGVAAVWTVDLPLKRGTEWNDGLAAEIKGRLAAAPEAWLSVAFSHPHPDDFDIARFTGISPFRLEEWESAWRQPVVTFVWREDRVWNGMRSQNRGHGLMRRAMRRIGLLKKPAAEQHRQVVRLAAVLRRALPSLDFAVAGLGIPGGLPEWISDLRTPDITEEVERNWCRRYARSHTIIGVHGSNMLLPSAHAGTTIDLMPEDRWGNILQDLLIHARDAREGLCRCHALPLETSAQSVAALTSSLISDFPFAMLNFQRPWNDHQAVQDAPYRIREHYARLRKRNDP